MSANPAGAIFRRVLIGYARVSTAEQNPAHQIVALLPSSDRDFQRFSEVTLRRLI
jgi:hypothetical protein